MSKELGLYIHIPFCEKKCDYCDFLSAPASGKAKKSYVKALLEEIRSYSEIAKDYLVKTVFIGGGTPSSLDQSDIADILQMAEKTFNIQKSAEITIESNPGTLTGEKLKIYKSSGINRLSIGLQSSDNNELKKLGRIHTYEEFLENYILAREIGYTNINIDLISGLPGQSLEDWEKTLEKIILLNPEHISAYSLIIEEGTPFFNFYGPSGMELLSEETDREIYAETKRLLMKNGYERYEISNYAKKGYESRHNSLYWKRGEYLGLGLGASSCINNVRFQNESVLKEYCEFSHDYNKIRRNIEPLTIERQMEEFMFLGLRMMEGIDKREFSKNFNIKIEEVYLKALLKCKTENLLMESSEKVFLTDRGIDVSNYVFEQFLL